jgi:Tat protein secretion system quality control protein TatD with DNase activity
VRVRAVPSAHWQEAREALALARTSPMLYSTVGVHPTRCNELFFGASSSSSSEHPASGVLLHACAAMPFD